MNTKNDAFDLVCLCARTSVGDEARERIRELLTRGVDWDEVFRLAALHGASCLLQRNLQAFPELVPAPYAQQLRRYCAVLAADMLRHTKELVSIARLLQGSGVPVIPFKGPTLGDHAYGDAALRHFTDLDLFIRREDFPRALDALTSAGYARVHELNAVQEEALIATQVGFDLHHPVKRIAVEVHWALINVVHAFKLDPETLWRHSSAYSLAGAEMRRFSDEHLLMYLCAHGSKSFWERLIWVCDVAQLITRRPNINWDFVLSESSRIHSERMLYLGLELARRLLGAPLPLKVVARIERDPYVRRLADEIISGWMQSAAAADSKSRTRLHLLMRERLVDRIPYLIHLTRVYLTPNRKDKAYVRLPLILRPLYVFIRPVRLLLDALRTAGSSKDHTYVDGEVSSGG